MSTEGSAHVQPHTSLEVAFRHGVTKEQVHKALDGIFTHHGCRTCGLVGLDLTLGIERVSRVPELRGLEGVASVTSVLAR